jgi:hypothetical protein
MTVRAIVLDPVTLQFCATLARATAEGLRAMPNARAHHNCAAGALEALADDIEAAPRKKAAGGG